MSERSSVLVIFLMVYRDGMILLWTISSWVLSFFKHPFPSETLHRQNIYFCCTTELYIAEYLLHVFESEIKMIIKNKNNSFLLYSSILQISGWSSPELFPKWDKFYLVSALLVFYRTNGLGWKTFIIFLCLLSYTQRSGLAGHCRL